MKCPVDTALEQCEEGLRAIHMDIATRIFPLAVIDGLMLELFMQPTRDFIVAMLPVPFVSFS